MEPRMTWEKDGSGRPRKFRREIPVAPVSGQYDRLQSSQMTDSMHHIATCKIDFILADRI